MTSGSPATRRPRKPAEVAAWLRGRPTLAEMRAVYPEEWEHVQEQVTTLVRRGEPDRLVEQLKELANPADPTPGRMPAQKALVAEAVRRQMLTEAVRQALITADTGISDGKLRFGLVNGFVLQRLLFEHDLHRKPVNYPLFRTLWPLLPQRRRLMPLVMQQGIYCFYARPLLRAIHRLAAGRPCLEIAAGDGTLTRLLAAQGTRITATDDHSWEIDTGDGEGVGVESLDAVAALRTHSPEVVICSWPPPGNTFERHVFTTPSVQLYVLLTTSHEVAAGNWKAYREQQHFDMTEDARLSRYLLPQDINGAVYLFRRRDGSRRGSA